MGGAGSSLINGFSHFDSSVFDYFPSGAWTVASNSAGQYTVSNSSISNASVVFTIPQQALGYCLYSYIPLQSPQPNMSVYFNGVQYPVDPNYNISTWSSWDNGNSNPLKQLFQQQASQVRAFFCRDIVTTGSQPLSLNQTGPGSIEFRGYGIYGPVYHNSIWNESTIAGIACAALALLICLGIFGCWYKKSRRQKQVAREAARAEEIAERNYRSEIQGIGGEEEVIPASSRLDRIKRPFRGKGKSYRFWQTGDLSEGTQMDRLSSTQATAVLPTYQTELPPGYHEANRDSRIS